jgi:hypothetical protein
MFVCKCGSQGEERLVASGMGGVLVVCKKCGATLFSSRKVPKMPKLAGKWKKQVHWITDKMFVEGGVIFRDKKV